MAALRPDSFLRAILAAFRRLRQPSGESGCGRNRRTQENSEACNPVRVRVEFADLPAGDSVYEIPASFLKG
jgi:hypothetical protein